MSQILTSPTWELSGDQYELFPLPPGPSRMFRQLLGMPDPAPELIAEPIAEVELEREQYNIFPELMAALKDKSAAPSDMIDDSSLQAMQETLNPTMATLAALLQEGEALAAENVVAAGDGFGPVVSAYNQPPAPNVVPSGIAAPFFMPILPEDRA